jgi:amidase
VSSQELVDLYLERIDRLNPELNAYVTVVRAPEAVRGDGPFAGVPIPIKDLTETAGIRTTFSSRAFADNVPQRDAAVVRRIRDAGFVVIGKTNTPEFGITAVTESELHGACRNPWDTSRTPGGSSGGAACAVAAGLAPIAHGSDGGGSIRIPASCCGLFGIKPARGRVSTAPYGDVVGWSVAGPLARTVRDAAALLDVMQGYEPGDPHWAPPPARPFAAECDEEPGRLRIALSLTPPIDAPVAPECERAARDAAALLEELGHDVVEAEPPWRSEELPALFMRVWQLVPALYPVRDASLLGPLNRMLAGAAHETPAPSLMHALSQLQVLARGIVAFCLHYDAVLTPTLAQPPVPVGWVTGADDPREQVRRAARFTPFTQVANLTGQPAVSLPLHWSDDGLPVGVQLLGRPADEATLIRLSAQLERARPWRDRRPPV